MEKITLGEDNDEVEVNNTNVKFTRWNKEEEITLNYVPEGNESLDLVKKDTENFDFKIVVNSIPVKNSWVHTITGYENFDFHYQPPMSDDPMVIEARQEGDSVTDTEHKDSEGNVLAYCDEDVVGSYAVYHKTKKNHIKGQTNYKVGKFCHIYRPKATDNKGAWTWGTLNINNGVMTITFDRGWLDNASYPVTIT